MASKIPIPVNCIRFAEGCRRSMVLRKKNIVVKTVIINKSPATFIGVLGIYSGMFVK